MSGRENLVLLELNLLVVTHVRFLSSFLIWLFAGTYDPYEGKLRTHFNIIHLKVAQYQYHVYNSKVVFRAFGQETQMLSIKDHNIGDQEIGTRKI